MSKLPIVTAALVCERVLYEQDGVPSLIRIVDNFTLRPDPPISPELLPPNLVMRPIVNLWLYLNLKPGGLRGVHSVVIQVRAPSGKVADVAQWDDVDFEDGNGVHLVLPFKLPAVEWGDHVFEVSWDGEPLISTPITLVLGKPLSEDEGET